MPRIIYGTAWKVDRTADLVERAVMAGFRGIDTACQVRLYYRVVLAPVHRGAVLPDVISLKDAIECTDTP